MPDIVKEFGTHLPALIKAINATDGPVLELGMGIFSTPFLHFACYPERKLVSYENVGSYKNDFDNFRSTYHQIHLIDDWSKADLSGHWSVALIDHEPAIRRKEDIKRLADNTDYIIIHDTNPKTEHRFRYREIYPLFKYRMDFNYEKPHTTILSNFKDPQELFKKGETTTKIVGFQSGHDVAYCILKNGVPTLVEEWERLTREKQQLGDGLKLFFERQKNLEDIKYFTFGNVGGRNNKTSRGSKDEASDKKMQEVLTKNGAKYVEFGHHLSHAANAFYTSDFDEALIITMDGGGNEDDTTRTAFTISSGTNNKIERILTIPVRKLDLGGIWYSSTTQIFGLSVGYPLGDQAGTVMAMATLGKPLYTSLFSNYRANLQELQTISNKSGQDKFNVAASLQEYTEAKFKSTVAEYISGHTNLCLSGGVSLNCVMLGKIKIWFPSIKNIFCDPVPYDAGTALGSARYLWHHVLGNPRISDYPRNMSPYLGKLYSHSDVTNAISQFTTQVKTQKTTDQEVLNKISEQKIIAVFGGGSESGRRALGNRSILADPRNPDMKNIINEKVKHRAWFRPVAPSILEEKVADWFENPTLSPYMTFALQFKEDKKDLVPAVVHFDGTGRLQTVSENLNPWYHGFISQWEKLSGVPILVNTSFNDSEPIVETPIDALKCFLKTKIDYLYFFNYGILVSKL